jgi:hypothetical protein
MNAKLCDFCGAIIKKDEDNWHNTIASGYWDGGKHKLGLMLYIKKDIAPKYQVEERWYEPDICEVCFRNIFAKFGETLKPKDHDE